MRQVLLIVAGALTLVMCGCASLPVAQIPTVAIPQADKVLFEDQRVSPSAGPFLFAEGNVYSCHYGIKKIGDGAMQPDRMTALHSYLDNRVFKDGKPHTVIVTRFDIYWNQHVTGERGVFGLAGEAISSSGYVIGCKGAEEGEYYSSEVPSPEYYASGTPGKFNYSAIVIYLRSKIDGQEYNVRTVYPVLEDSDTKSRWPANLTAAVDKAFATLGSMVEKDENGT